MTSEQLKELARLTMSVRDVLGELRIIEQSLAGQPTAIPERASALHQVMRQLQADTAALAVRVQDQRVREWLVLNPARAVRPVRSRTSSEIDHGLPVRRFNMDGRLKSELAEPAPPITGRWQTEALGRPKPRRSSSTSVPAPGSQEER